MNTAIAEFNLLYPRFEAHSFNTQCEVVETNPRTPSDFQRFVVKDACGYVFPRELAKATISFYDKAGCPDPMRLNCDGIFCTEVNNKKCMFLCELKSTFDSSQIFHAREQIIGTLMRLKAKASILQTQVDWEYHGVIVSYEPTDRQLDALNKLSSNDGRFAKTLCAKRHKVIRNELAQKYYHPLSIPDLNIHYVAVPNRNPEYELDMQTLINL